MLKQFNGSALLTRPSQDTRALIEIALDEIDEISQCHGEHVRQHISPPKREAKNFFGWPDPLPIFWG
jgi:hypothetical protein